MAARQLCMSVALPYLSHSALEAPMVEDDTVTGTAGEPLTLMCSDSYPANLVRAPDVQWLHSNGTILSNTDTLTFDPPRTSDGGQYNCTVNISIPQLGIMGLVGMGMTDLTVQSEWLPQICMYNVIRELL